MFSNDLLLSWQLNDAKEYKIVECPYFSYTQQQMDLEIQRVAREMYKAFSGMNEGFADVRREFG